ncbi:glycoside hydrolase family 15 protein [Tortispora caseinolytica NRRL Y-17796]|uniref:glucan 1,4-alpha-glucosidase n=1 Tax=Tortispora caseinolytica NRRL Y-17796 TaxID=767744 RepID=A0A1E4TAJ8_9ASCO|nr:glycoside hydrolase family 15 protein [Tortispora caseinolytica NRRL Y-17796]
MHLIRLCLTIWTLISINAEAGVIPEYVLNTGNHYSANALQSLDSWIEEHRIKAFNYAVDNIGPRAGPEVVPGTVVASPSREYPNYFYQWIRDAGLTIHSLIDEYANGTTTDKYSLEDLELIFANYIELSRQVQRTSNPSGTMYTGGLGEPKFEVDGSPFTGAWGRPQRDGPPIRALALMHYVDIIRSGKGDALADQLLDSIIDLLLPDLQYTAETWGFNGFDLWEEVSGIHFFTASMQRQALLQGALVLSSSHPRIAAYLHAEAMTMGPLIRNFYDSRRGHLVETLYSSRSGLDAALFLAMNHAKQEGTTFSCASCEVLSTLMRYIKDNRARYPVNFQRQSPTSGVAVGRYPEDVYDGVGMSRGNPWFLATAAMAEQMYNLVIVHEKEGSVIVPCRAVRDFYRELLVESSVDPDTVLPQSAEAYPVRIGPDSEAYDAIIRGLLKYGDSFIAVIRHHTDAEGRMSEQLDAVTGFQRGAHDLTWSYCAFLDAVRARAIAYSLTA